ncbi:DUF2332 family protein [Amycolatopsis acidicola]|uniref:DUF2332 family protein n=1 Tax=Amycolatopsis acidicola TaxID=2596893 RepID=A0A5N0USQ4_9PSEU|nr:DUF2332 domain-containing protein [Amycolatopsis acidicola]KAA9153873.1 DUF2332 family protein [Amycolatopsis acidicola]
MTGRVARIYTHFAEVEAPAKSRIYAELAAQVAREPRLLGFLAELPPEKWQPNLFFSAVQYLCGPIPDWPWFRARFTDRADEIRDVMLTHRTQTNEPARCATLLPALAQLPQPLALLEVGASAGLCLQPDRYGYDYGRVTIPGPLTLSCTANDATPLPSKVPEVVWRAGLDLDPVDVTSADDCAWLDALIWPGEEERRPRLRKALEIAAQEPPPVRRGDLRADFASLASEAPKDATLVVFHTAVLVYVQDAAERAAFAESVRDAGAVWLANEASTAIPGVEIEDRPADYLLARDGRPLAWAESHGNWVNWL